MTKNKNIKVCRYKFCGHASREIDINHDEYTMSANRYYHQDCYTYKLESDKNQEYIKTCRYIKCKHDSKKINTAKEEYVVKNSQYYHKDCYHAKLNGEWKDEKTKSDLQLIKELWVENISETVVFSQLFYHLNKLLARGIDSEYLVFVMRYIIAHQLNLNYPPGFQYFVDNKKIKNAYAKEKLRANLVKSNAIKVKENDSDAPKFSVRKKQKGFQTILNHQH